MADVFELIQAERTAAGVRDRGVRARRWLRNNVDRVYQSAQQTDRSMTNGGDSGPVGRNMEIGKLYMYMYTAKHRQTLPYWDRFPLVFLVGGYEDGWLGLNMHYLPQELRLRLFNGLLTLRNNNSFDDRTKLQLNYKVLKGISRFRMAQPCIKRYLVTHVRSKVREIPAQDWETALYLPVERFEKASAAKVWDDSRGASKRRFFF